MLNSKNTLLYEISSYICTCGSVTQWCHTDNSKAFERKLFRVFLIIKGNCFFKNNHESLLSEPLQVAFV